MGEDHLHREKNEFLLIDFGNQSFAVRATIDDRSFIVPKSPTSFSPKNLPTSPLVPVRHWHHTARSLYQVPLWVTDCSLVPAFLVSRCLVPHFLHYNYSHFLLHSCSPLLPSLRHQYNHVPFSVILLHPRTRHRQTPPESTHRRRRWFYVSHRDTHLPTLSNPNHLATPDLPRSFTLPFLN